MVEIFYNDGSEMEVIAFDEPARATRHHRDGAELEHDRPHRGHSQSAVRRAEKRCVTLQFARARRASDKSTPFSSGGSHGIVSLGALRFLPGIAGLDQMQFP